jgi:hypothetical protein
MTLVAILVRGTLNQQLGIGRAVGVMAINTRYLPLPEGHMRRTQELRAAELMALETDPFAGRFNKVVLFGQWFNKAVSLSIPHHCLMARGAG